jgi:hypothetical protein
MPHPPARSYGDEAMLWLGKHGLADVRTQVGQNPVKREYGQDSEYHTSPAGPHWDSERPHAIHCGFARYTTTPPNKGSATAIRPRINAPDSSLRRIVPPAGVPGHRRTAEMLRDRTRAACRDEEPRMQVQPLPPRMTRAQWAIDRQTRVSETTDARVTRVRLADSAIPRRAGCSSPRVCSRRRSTTSRPASRHSAVREAPRPGHAPHARLHAPGQPFVEHAARRSSSTRWPSFAARGFRVAGRVPRWCVNSPTSARSMIACLNRRTTASSPAPGQITTSPPHEIARFTQRQSPSTCPGGSAGHSACRA